MKLSAIFFLALTFTLAASATQSPSNINCESSPSPIHLDKGDKIRILIQEKPLWVKLLDKDGKLISEYGQGKIDGEKYESNSYACTESASISSAVIEAKYSCETTTLPEANKYSVNQELILNSSGARFQGQIRTFESGEMGSSLYLWDCQ